jgi:hypothetical protein
LRTRHNCRDESQFFLSTVDAKNRVATATVVEKLTKKTGREARFFSSDNIAVQPGGRPLHHAMLFTRAARRETFRLAVFL